MYAVVEILGKQYRAEKGATLRVDRMEGDAGSSVSFDAVLMVGGDKVSVGAPYVKGASVKAVIQEHNKGDKLIVFKYKSKKNYRRTYGHRQCYSVIKIEDVIGA